MGLEAFVTEDNNDKKQTDSTDSVDRRRSDEGDGADKIDRLGREKYIKLIMLFRTRDKEGNYMGPDPPSKFEKGHLPEEEWDDRWIDATGEFEYKDDKPVKYTDCQNCGKERIWSGHRSRYIRCSECGAVHMDKLWQDDRVENMHKKDTLDKWT